MGFTSKKEFVDYLCEQVEIKPPRKYEALKTKKSVCCYDNKGKDIAVVLLWKQGEREVLVIRIYPDGVKSVMVWTNYASNGFAYDMLDNYADWTELESVTIIQ